MTDKKLTKAQRELLEMMRDKDAKIAWNSSSARYRLYLNGDKLKTVQSDTFHFLKPWLTSLDQTRDIWAFKPGAEISDTWRTQELERQRLERQQKREEQDRIKEEALQALIGRLKDAFAAIERGEIDNGAVEYDYQARFEYNGKWYSLSEEEPTTYQQKQRPEWVSGEREE